MGLSCFETVMISRNIWAVNGGCPGGPELATFQGSDIFGMEIFGQQLVLGGWIIAPVRRSSLLIVIFPPGILAPTVEHDVLSALPSFHLQVKTSDLYG